MERPTSLSLTRSKGEQVIIGDDVIVTVTDLRKDKVRLTFTAPPGIRIDRMEVRRAMRAEQAEKEGGEPS